MTDKQLAALRAQAIQNAAAAPPDPKALDRINRLRHGIFAEDVIVPQLGETKVPTPGQHPGNSTGTAEDLKETAAFTGFTKNRETGRYGPFPPLPQTE